MEKKVKIAYDGDADVLYLSFGEPRKGIVIPNEDGDLIRVDQLTEEVIGVTVTDFVERYL